MKRNKSLQLEPATRRLRTGLSRFPRILLWIGAASVTAIGCGWFGTQHSVRFNAYQSEREMGRLPPLPTMADGLNDLRASREMDDNDQDSYALAQRNSEDIDKLWDQAGAVEQAGDLSLDRDLLLQYLERTTIARKVWFDPMARQLRRNSAIDRLDALKALDHGSSVSRIGAYLNARRSHDAEKPDAEAIQRALDEVGNDPNLSDNVAYLKAAELYQQEDFEAAAKAFSAVARRYPRSEKRDGAVFMSAVALMKTSVVFASDEEESATDESPDELAKPKIVLDEAGRDAMAVFRKVSGEFRNDARGWIAYLKLHSNERAGALVEYYRLLGDKHDESVRVEAAFSLQLVRGSATDEEMSRVELALENEPDAALAYAYHNLYNYAIDPGSAYPPYDDEEIRDYQGNINYEAQQARDEERDKQWQKERAATGRKEMSRVLEFSSRLIRRYPNVATGGGFALRAAQASLELGNNEAAVQFAQRAIQSRVTGNERAQALWTNGVAEYRLGHFEIARKHIATLLRDYPTGPLLEEARRLQAMIAEDSGDIDGALEQYIALDYHLDVAYFVDVLLTTEQLAAFIQRHPESPKSNELIYALGLRYLRANRWDDARQTFAKVKLSRGSDSDSYDAYSYNAYGKCEFGDVKPGCGDPKEPGFTAEKQIITPALVMRDVQTANDLEALERAVNQADGDEARAEALYQFASYQFEASSLLFYNPIAWRGERYWNLSQLADEARYRAPNEPQILWSYMQEHDRLARALKIYLEIAKRFPKAHAAPDALYSAAVCHERLSNSNPYWRSAYEGGLHAGERMVTYTDVKAAYPRYQLPRGTYSWNPATRTVNGGPGWSAPPKPTPRPTRLARIRNILVSRIIQPVERFWELTGRHWTLVIFLAIATVIVGRIAARTRAMLRSLIVCQRLRENCEETYPWMILFRLEPVELTRPERARLLLRSAGERVWRLARDAESRPVLIVGIFAHSLLAWSFVNLVQTLLIRGAP